jgi:hypothetical protein
VEGVIILTKVCNECGKEMVGTLVFTHEKSGTQLEKFYCEECDNSIMVPVQGNKQYENLDIEVLKIAFNKACEDAADGCCPYDFKTGYESEECINCPNTHGGREDIGKDIECWKKYYLQKAQEDNNA